MKPIQRAGLFLWFAFAVVFVLDGCVAIQPFPMAARAGDTITLAVGSPDNMSKVNTTATFTSYVDGSTTTLTITEIFKLYPDKTSAAWISKSASIGPWGRHGAWLTIAAIDLPASLPVGTGVINVTAGSEVTYPNFAKSINNTSISIEILSGTGSANPLEYISDTFSGVTVGNVRQLRPWHQAVVRVPVRPGINLDTYGAVEIKVNVPTASYDGSVVPDGEVLVISDEQSRNLTSQISMTWKRNGDDYTVYFISPTGFTDHETRFSVVPIRNLGHRITGPLTLTSVNYFDLNGNPVSGTNLEIVLQEP